jgi:hypothetical protein
MPSRTCNGRRSRTRGPRTRGSGRLAPARTVVRSKSLTDRGRGTPSAPTQGALLAHSLGQCLDGSSCPGAATRPSRRWRDGVGRDRWTGHGQGLPPVFQETGRQKQRERVQVFLCDPNVQGPTSLVAPWARASAPTCRAISIWRLAIKGRAIEVAMTRATGHLLMPQRLFTHG